MNVVEVARELLDKYKSFAELSRCSVKELSEIKGIGPAKALELVAAFNLGKRFAQEPLSQQKLDSPELIHELLGGEMRMLRTESLRVVLLDTRYRLMRVESVSMGSMNESIAHPREIFRPAITYSAYAVIVVHNHPSGDPSPSQTDHSLTRRLAEAAELLQIKLLDHIIIGAPSDDESRLLQFQGGRRVVSGRFPPRMFRERTRHACWRASRDRELSFLQTMTTDQRFKKRLFRRDAETACETHALPRMLVAHLDTEDGHRRLAAAMMSSAKIHPTAIVDPDAQIGENVEIGPFSIIGPQVVIGEKTIVQSHVVIEGEVAIGTRQFHRARRNHRRAAAGCFVFARNEKRKSRSATTTSFASTARSIAAVPRAAPQKSAIKIS